MSTTPLIVEILLIGYTALIWIAILLFPQFKPYFDMVRQIIPEGYSITLCAIVITAMAYQIGWALDHLSYLLFYYIPFPIPIFKMIGSKDNHPLTKKSRKFFWTSGRIIKRRCINKGDFWNYYTDVYQNGSPNLVKQLNIDLSVVRITRTALINIPLVALTVVKFIPQKVLFAIIVFVIEIILFMALYLRWSEYFNKLDMTKRELMRIPEKITN